VLIPFLHNPRPGVVYLKCIYNRYNDARRKGVGAALMRSLIDDCRNGLDTLNGEGCSFISTILLHEDDPALDDFYSKYGFKNGEGELYLEINGSYTPMEVPELAPLPEDKDRAIFTYSPDCEWGYYVSTVGKQMIQEKYPEYPVDVYDIWNEPEQYKKRGGGWMLIIGGLLINGVIPEAPPLFWYDRERWFQNVEKAMGLV